MTLGLTLELVVVSLALVAGTVREYRLQHRPGRSDKMVLLHAVRMVGFLMVGFGLLGLFLDGAGFGGDRPLVETLHVGLAFGFWPVAQTAYVEGSTKLAQVSDAGLGWGVQVFVVCTLALWWCSRRRPSAPAGA